VEHREFLEAIRRESLALAEAAQDGLTSDVPACPGWTVRELLLHISEVQRFWALIVGRRLRRREDATKEQPPPEADLVEWFRRSSQALVSALDGTDPSTKVWTWAPQKNVAFVLRRQAHEAAVHRIDAEAARGVVRPIESELAADGIDEFFQYMATEPVPPDDLHGRTVLLSATDGQGDWLATVREDRLEVERRPGFADATVTSSASDLDLLLWRRIPADAVSVAGDRELVERFVAWPDLT